jgi:hypothetical protein
METAFFASEYGQELLRRISKQLQALQADEKVSRLREAIRIVANNAKDFDENAAANVGWIGKVLAGDVEAFEKDASPGAVDSLYATFYRYVTEYELSIPEGQGLSLELNSFVSYARVNETEFSADAQRQLRFANHGMPLLIMRRLLGSSAIVNLRNIEQYSGEVAQRFGEWDRSLGQHEEHVQRLEKALKEYETGFNFVGLHKGFDDLAQEKKKELSKLRIAMLAMGALALAPVAAELIFVFLNVARFDAVRWALTASAFPVISLTVLFVYYFRMAARAVDGAKSQLLQLELRKTLCRFIQSYADYANKMKDSRAESLAKFENIVFSGVVNSEEKMPATFDGMDQLTKLLKAVKAP